MKYLLIVLSCIVSSNYAASSKKEDKIKYFAYADGKQDTKIKKNERKRTRYIIKKDAKRYVPSFGAFHFKTT